MVKATTPETETIVGVIAPLAVSATQVAQCQSIGSGLTYSGPIGAAARNVRI